MKGVWVDVVKRDAGEFYKVNVGRGAHGKVQHILWIAKPLLYEDEKGNKRVDIVGVDRRIVKTEKGNFVLRREQGWITYDIGWECGYRGSSSFEILTPLPEDSIVLKYDIYHSERGSLGISTFALVSTRLDRIAVSLKRSGRLYGKPAKTVREYYVEEGEVKERDIPEACMDEELAELLVDEKEVGT
ncbi:hypothetical protein [Hydrogenobacter thermophilus]|uniref:hypothetical protein n=1 Tax=Hydrogenobacter thermophilus TaxID=940 RepID=UPI0030FCB259